MHVQFKAEAIEDMPGYFNPVIRLIGINSADDYPISEMIVWMGLRPCRTEQEAEREAAAYIMEAFAKMLSPTRIVRL